MDKVGVGRGASEQNINFCLKRSKWVQLGPKGSKRSKTVRLAIWTLLECFKQDIDILLRSTSANPYFVHLGQKNHFCLNWSKRVQMGPKGFLMVKNTQVDHFGPFRTLLDHFGVLTSLPCLALFGPKWTIFRPSPVMNGRPQSEKKAHHHVSYVWPACGTPNVPFWNINMVAINEKCQKQVKIP